MASDDDFVVASGPLRLKGSKIEKKKKKKNKNKNKNKQDELVKALSTGDEGRSKSREPVEDDGNSTLRKEDEDNLKGDDVEGEEEDVADDDGPDSYKTETERKFEEVRRKRLLKLAEQPGARPELLKTHRQRVEELNTYLSKLSEHHDMPKIGPG